MLININLFIHRSNFNRINSKNKKIKKNSLLLALPAFFANLLAGNLSRTSLYPRTLCLSSRSCCCC